MAAAAGGIIAAAMAWTDCAADVATNERRKRMTRDAAIGSAFNDAASVGEFRQPPFHSGPRKMKKAPAATSTKPMA